MASNPFDQYNDYDDYTAPSTTAEPAIFTTLGPTDKDLISTLQLRQNVKRDKLAVFYRHLNVTSDLDFINIDWFNYIKIPKQVLQF